MAAAAAAAVDSHIPISSGTLRAKFQVVRTALLSAYTSGIEGARNLEGVRDRLIVSCEQQLWVSE